MLSFSVEMDFIFDEFHKGKMVVMNVLAHCDE
jgi:hypothetical protein